MYISGYQSAVGRAQDTESSPVKDRRSTTVVTLLPNIIIDSIVTSESGTVREATYSGRTSVFDRRTFRVLRSTYSWLVSGDQLCG